MRLPTTPLTTALRELRAEVRQHYPAGRVVLAVDGGADAGASQFADEFALVLAEDGDTVFRAHLDDFLRPRAEREARGSAEGEYRDRVDEATLRRVLIDPFRLGGSTGFQLAAFDRLRDAPVESEWVTGPRDAVLVIDGPFLLRPGLRGLWNWSVRLDVSVRRDPAEAEEPAEHDDDASRRAEIERLYLREADPRAVASALVDNSDPARPLRVFGDFC